MITLRGHVLLDPGEVEYLARALQTFAKWLRENRSEPTPRLESVTAQLTRCAQSAESGSAATSNGSKELPQGASDADARHPKGYAIATVTVAEAARLLGTGERNVRDLAARGRIPARRSGGVWLVDAAAVEARAAAKAARRGE